MQKMCPKNVPFIEKFIQQEKGTFFGHIVYYDAQITENKMCPSFILAFVKIQTRVDLFLIELLLKKFFTWVLSLFNSW